MRGLVKLDWQDIDQVTVLTTEHGSMIAREFGERARWTTREVGDDAGNGFGFATGSLISTDGESTVDDLRRVALPLAASSRFVR